jgi:hypothetical protein
VSEPNSPPACRFCDEARPLIKAHVIPRSFFTLVRRDANYSVFFQAHNSQLQTGFHQAGIYDSEILCDVCEARFSGDDTHGFEVLSKARGEENAIRDQSGTLYGVRLPDLDYIRFKFFILSVLWRASVSKHVFFSDINLGPHENIIRDALRERKPLDADQYAVVLLLPMGQPFKNTMLMPRQHRIGGALFYRLYFPNVIALVKVDQQPTPDPLARVQLDPHRESVFIPQPHKDSPEDDFFRGLHRYMKRHDLFDK